MVKKICLDTDACIAILRNEARAYNIKEVIAEAEVCVSVITVFELLLRKTHLELVEDFLHQMNRLFVDDSVARHASSQYKMLGRKGEIIDIRDVLIASSCVVNDCFLLTFNVKHFERIDDLKLVLV